MAIPMKFRAKKKSSEINIISDEEKTEKKTIKIEDLEVVEEMVNYYPRKNKAS